MVTSLSALTAIAAYAQDASQRTVTVNSRPSISVTRDWVDFVALTFSGVLMVAGVWGIVVALRTLKMVKRQADEMMKQAALMKEQTAIAEKAANAALLNAQAVINAERPWLLIYPSRSGTGHHSSFTFKAVNRGRSPAEVIISGFKTLTPRIDEELRATSGRSSQSCRHVLVRLLGRRRRSGRGEHPSVACCRSAPHAGGLPSEAAPRTVRAQEESGRSRTR